METKIDLDNLTDDQQQKMCELCEFHILECSSNSSKFQCEGSWCDQAFEYLIEDINGSKLSYRMQLKK